MKTLTVFTPAYNRGYIIHKCYESLCRQTSKDFVWLVVDDGSTDNTAQLIKEWQKQDNGFEIKYIYKENGGMHTAHNTAYENIDTELNVCIDSDDYMPDDAVEKIISFWRENGSDKFAGIIALDVYESNRKTIGSELPNKKSTTLMGYYRNGGSGDKKLIYRTDVINATPMYPEFEGEKYVGLAYKYHIVDETKELLIMNEPVCIVDYQEDGSSFSMWKQYYNNPKGFAFFRKSEMKYQHGLQLFKTCIHYVSSSIISKNKNFVKESPKKLMTVLAVPFGTLLSIVNKHIITK
ncbi:glycosyltransferase family A protein [uncultured Eubacterium sp.]|uniref:glycosyltransferase family 2 protein n=1 Tax=uncultured Eubacterium sp. TaxID=165185 RepID=UPI0025CFF77C|nr:glycosyltransferase family A protein [uncultured Eubacterium sp.]